MALASRRREVARQNTEDRFATSASAYGNGIPPTSPPVVYGCGAANTAMTPAQKAAFEREEPNRQDRMKDVLAMLNTPMDPPARVAGVSRRSHAAAGSTEVPWATDNTMNSVNYQRPGISRRVSEPSTPARSELGDAGAQPRGTAARNRIDPKQDALWSAVSSKDLPEVIRLVEQVGVDPEMQCPDGFGQKGNAASGGRSLLHQAAWAGDLDVFQYLFEHSGSFTKSKGMTPFHQACFYNRVPIVQYCIDQGIDVNATGEDGYTPLHLAAKHGYAKLLRTLLDAGADVDVVSRTDKTPWDMANADTREAVPQLRPMSRRDMHASQAPLVAVATRH